MPSWSSSEVTLPLGLQPSEQLLRGQVCEGECIAPCWGAVGFPGPRDGRAAHSRSSPGCALLSGRLGAGGWKGQAAAVAAVSLHDHQPLWRHCGVLLSGGVRTLYPGCVRPVQTACHVLPRSPAVWSCAVTWVQSWRPLVVVFVWGAVICPKADVKQQITRSLST